MNKSDVPSSDARRSVFSETGDNHPGSSEANVVRDFVAPILYGGIIAGTVDIGAACLINGAKPAVILQAVASGLLGKSAFSGGSTTVALGLVLQWAMSMIIATIFVL